MNAISVYHAVGWVRGDATAKVSELQDRLNETLKQLEQFRQKNEELQLRVDMLAELEPIRELARGEDKLQVEFDIAFKNERGQPPRAPELVVIESSWDRVFSAIAPPLFAAHYLYQVIESIVNEHKFDVGLGELAKIDLSKSSQDTIRNQLRSLQVIDLHISESDGRFRVRSEQWTLTEFGSIFLAKYVAQLRTNPPSKPTEN